MGFIREVMDAFSGVEKLTVSDPRLSSGGAARDDDSTVERRKPADPTNPATLPEGVLEDRRKARPVFGKANRS